MPAKLRLELTTQEVLDLEEIRDQASKPYLRERAAAILKIAQGNSGREVALHGLEIKPGRGRKPAFFPSLSERGGG
jgi:hypothetical protein